MIESEESSATGTKSVTDNNNLVTSSALIAQNLPKADEFNVKVNKAYINKNVRPTIVE